MKYFYYSLFKLYSKVFKESDSPILNVVGLISAIETFAVFSIVDFIVFRIRKDHGVYSYIIPWCFMLALFYLNFKHFENKEDNIIKELDQLSDLKKIISYVLTGIVVIVTLWVYIFGTTKE